MKNKKDKVRRDGLYDSREIATYMLTKARQEGKSLDRLQVLKLVYLAHGWCLGVYNEPLIKEQIEAWPYGPVIRKLYYSVKNTSTNEVPTNWFASYYDEDLKFPEEIQVLLDAVWEDYKEYKGIKLSDICHAPGSPWEQVNLKSAIVDDDVMKEYYGSRWQKKLEQQEREEQEDGISE